MKFTIRLYVLLAIFTLPYLGKADHISGGEMFYKYLNVQNGNYNYEVTLRLLMRCNSGRMFPNPIIIGVFSKIDNFRISDIQVPLTLQERISLGDSDPCISNAPDVCYEVAKYVFSVSLPANDSGYQLVAAVNFRVNGLANLSVAGSVGATYTADIPGRATVAEAEKNTSAHFTGSDLVVVCANSPFTYSFGAIDADADSLEYSFCGAYGSGSFGGSGANSIPPSPPPYGEVSYATFYGPDMPLGSHVKINPANGIVSGLAPGVGIYVITVCVTEKRNGKVIAIQRKDIQLNITGCVVAAAMLEPSYQLCKDRDEITFENLSGSPLIQSYSWHLFTRNGTPVASSSSPRFTHQFTDTGLYKVVLKTNVGLTCPDSTSSDVIFYPGFRANFTFKGICFGFPTQFSNSSTARYGSVNTFFWDLGEPINSFNYQPNVGAEIIYLLAGEKTATLRVTNTNGCIDSVSLKLAVSTNPPLDLNFRDTLICPPDTLRIIATGGGSFSWANLPGILSGTGSPILKVAPLISTKYIVSQILDNCVGRDTIYVRVADRVELRVMNDTIICAGDELVLRTSGNGTRFKWVSSPVLYVPAVPEPLVSVAQSTWFTVTAFVSQCFVEEDIMVRTVPYPLISAGQDVAVCFGQSVILRAETNGNRVEWTPGSTLNNPFIANPLASPASTISYMVSVYDDEGCPKPSFDTVEVKVEAPILLQGASDTTIVVGQPLQMKITGAPRFSWIPTQNLSNPGIADPVIRFTRSTEGLHYTIIGFNDTGCADSLEFTVRVFSTEPSIFMPTAFTPNRDGLNETLKPTLAGMKQFDFFRVFNRYGQLIFETNTQNKGWDGKLNGYMQPSGSFVWMVGAVDYSGKPVLAKGSTMLIR